MLCFRTEDYRQLRPIVLTELIDYLLATDQTERITDILKSAPLIDIADAGVHFQAARYFARIDNALATEESLRNAEALFRKNPPDTIYEQELFIRLLGTRARLAAEQGDFEQALQLYNQAIQQFELSLDSGTVVPRAFFGALYAGRGDVYYLANNAYQLALDNYQAAQRQLYRSADMDYAIGSILYRSLDYRQATLLFEGAIGAAPSRATDEVDAVDLAIAADSGTGRASGDGTRAVVSISDGNALYALANSFFLLDGYAIAIGYYRELITLLEREVDPNRLFVDQRDFRYRSVTEMLIAAYNNTGVAYARLHQIQSDQEYDQKSSFYLQRAGEQYTNYLRNSNIDLVGGTLSLPYRNSFAQLHNNAEQLQIYRALPPTRGDYFISFIDGGAVSSSTLSDPRLRRTEFP